MRKPDYAKEISEMEDALESILDTAIIHHHDSVSGETFQECILCNGWDEHMNHCPIGAIDKWVNSNITDNGA